MTPGDFNAQKVLIQTNIILALNFCNQFHLSRAALPLHITDITLVTWGWGTPCEATVSWWANRSAAGRGVRSPAHYPRKKFKPLDISQPKTERWRFVCWYSVPAQVLEFPFRNLISCCFSVTENSDQTLVLLPAADTTTQHATHHYSGIKES